MQTPPLVSIIIPTFNRPERLRIALKSLAWQTFKDFEVIVVNDGDEDVSPVTSAFASSLALTLKESPHRRSGPSAARNVGVQAARGVCLCYLDDDDFFYEDHLGLLFAAMYRSGHSVVYSDGIQAKQKLVDGELETVLRCIPLSFDFDHARLAGENITPVLCVMHHANCLKRTGPFASYLRGHEDWDLWQRLARHCPFWHIDTPTCEYLVREGSVSMSGNIAAMAESWRFVRRQGLLFHSMPPVYTLEQRAAAARRLGPAGEPCRVGVILGVGDAGAFLDNPAACAALDGLCGRISDSASALPGAVRLAAAGCGEAMPALYERLARMAPGLARCLWFTEDPGRLFAANKAAESLEAEWLLFLEPFVEPADGRWLDALLESAAAPGTGAVGGVMELRGKPSLAGGVLSKRDEVIFNRTIPEGAGTREAYCLSGLCLMARRDIFLSLGGFDPAFAPWHYADADFCLRLRERGYTSLVAPGARFHWNSAQERLLQTSSGLTGRRAFWDRWLERPFPMEHYIAGSDWSMRPRSGLALWQSEGSPPLSYDVPVPPGYQKAILESAPGVTVTKAT